jgi:predicted acylesterase/phospholipase RssA
MAIGRAAELPGVWRSLVGRSIVSLRRVLWNRSIFDMSHMVRTTIRELLGAGDLRSAPAEVLACATKLRRLEPVVFSSRHEVDFVEPLLGSCFLPPLYGRPVRVRGEWLLDGGFTDNLPIGSLLERGAEEIIAVVTSSDGTAIKSPSRLRWRPKANGVRVHVIHPLRPLAIGHWDFRKQHVDAAIAEGMAAGDRFLERRLATRSADAESAG